MDRSRKPFSLVVLLLTFDLKSITEIPITSLVKFIENTFFPLYIISTDVSLVL